MTGLLTTLAIISFLLIPVFFVIAIISLIRKKPVKKWFIATGASALLWIIFLMIPTCEHEWIDATCLAPKTCSLCEKTDGDVIDHIWVEATCSAPKHCSMCELSEGEMLEHTWIEATCTEPKSCTVCNAKEGLSLGHAYGEWVITDKATISTSGKKQRICSTCENVDSESYELDSYVEDGKFIFTPEEFSDMFFDNSVALGSSKFGGASTRTKEGQVMVDIRDNAYNNAGNIGFVANKNTWKMASSDSESGFDGLIMMISSSDELVANSMLALIMSCDPDASELDARLTAADTLKATATLNGIEYSVKKTGTLYTMTAVPSV